MRGKPIDANRIVAELPFGFWCGMFGRKHEITWHGLLKKRIPWPHRKTTERKTIAARLDKIRWFQNRVFHYERTLHHDLPATHKSIYETIEWMNEAMAGMVKIFDRFFDTHSNGFDVCHASIRSHYQNGT